MVGRKGGGTVHHTPTKIKIQLSTHTCANTHAHIYRVHKEQSWSFESCPPLLGFMRVNAESPPLQFCVSALQLQGSRPRCQRVECGAWGGCAFHPDVKMMLYPSNTCWKLHWSFCIQPGVKRSSTLLFTWNTFAKIDRKKEKI